MPSGGTRHHLGLWGVRSWRDGTSGMGWSPGVGSSGLDFDRSCRVLAKRAALLQCIYIWRLRKRGAPRTAHLIRACAAGSREEWHGVVFSQESRGLSAATTLCSSRRFGDMICNTCVIMAPTARCNHHSRKGIEPPDGREKVLFRVSPEQSIRLFGTDPAARHLIARFASGELIRSEPPQALGQVSVAMGGRIKGCMPLPAQRPTWWWPKGSSQNEGSRFNVNSLSVSLARFPVSG